LTVLFIAIALLFNLLLARFARGAYRPCFAELSAGHGRTLVICLTLTHSAKGVSQTIGRACSRKL
jgi:hypothetical protein